MLVKPMRERNPTIVAIVGTAMVLAIVLAAINLDSLPIINSNNSYTVDFADANGIKSGDDVRVEGISVGEVDDVSVRGAHVAVAIHLQSDVHLGRNSGASIEVATVLGNQFVQIESAGSGTMSDGATIPVSRTRVPFSLLGALDSFADFGNHTKLPTLRASLASVAKTVNGIAPADVRATLEGLSKISTTIAGKQQQIATVLQAANSISSTLDNNSGALIQLLSQGDQFLKLVEQRHAVIAQLLRDTAALGTQIDQLIRRNGAPLHDALASLDTVTKVLVKERDQLQQAIINLGQFSVNITNATGSGPWLDLLSPTAVVPDNQVVGCALAPGPKKPCDE